MTNDNIHEQAVKKAKEIIIKWNPYMAQVMPELVRVLAEALESHLVRIEVLERMERSIMDLSHPNIKLYRDEDGRKLWYVLAIVLLLSNQNSPLFLVRNDLFYWWKSYDLPHKLKAGNLW